MLVLTRKLDESILIGDDIVVTIVQIRGDKVRLGISAPDGVAVDRREVRESKIRDGIRAKEIDAGEDGEVA